jgi:tetratricopeptide (TPR) repeat protein/tRNA A-37 threonylcarbamoyl transferase component Bud32
MSNAGNGSGEGEAGGVRPETWSIDQTIDQTIGAGGPPGPAPADPFGPWPIGARFGSIRVIRRLAVGGMGEVFEGFDESLRRRVALKALRQDRLSRQARARLLLEARVLSQLSDPRICGVYGWIEDPGGEFLVLELIEGETLEGFFAKKKPRATLLRIAADLAEVLAASHRKGVIHRDLKPSNLMLTRTGKLKVLDFGISSIVSLPEPPRDDEASSLDLDFDEEALRSRAGAIVGTIHYMSPEQARGDQLTAASDMYSFGLVLEELLTGKKPHQDAAGVLEILIKLQKGERPAPSGLEPPLLELVAALTAAAPADRPTAADVVEKLAAIRDAPKRRLRRAAAAGVVALLIGAGLWHTHRLTVERNLARAAEQRALESQREAEEAVRFLESMFAGADPVKTDGQAVTVRQILDRGAERINQGLADQPAVRARLLATIGRASTRLGLLERADATLTAALAEVEKLYGEESRQAGDLYFDLGSLRREQDRHEESRELMLRSLEVARRHEGQGSAKATTRMVAVGQAEARLARFDEAEKLIREALEILEKKPADGGGDYEQAVFALAHLMRNRGRYLEAYELYQRGMGLEDPRHESLHSRGNNRYNAGITLSQLGRFDEAEKMLAEALEMWIRVYGPEHGNVAKVELALATIDRKKNRYEEAEKRYRRVLEIWSKTNGPRSTNVAFGLNNLGNLYLEQGELKRAEKNYRQALEIFESKVGKDHPNVAMTLANLGRCLSGQKRHREAIPLLRRVVEIDLKAGGPTSVDLGWDRLFLAIALWHQDRAAAKEEARQGLAILDPALGRDNPELRDLIAETPELFAGLP